MTRARKAVPFSFRVSDVRYVSPANRHNGSVAGV